MVDLEGKCSGAIAQDNGQTGADNTGMRDDGQRPRRSRHRVCLGQDRFDPCHDIAKAFAAGPGEIGQGSPIKRAHVRDLVKGQTVPCAEILLPKTGILMQHVRRPKSFCGTFGALCRAGPNGIDGCQIGPGRQRRNRGQPDIGATAEKAWPVGATMPDKDQFARVHLAATTTPFHQNGYLLCHVPMGKSILITGGARSGKSRIAEEWVQRQGASPIYIATAEAFDPEMEARIAAHKARRGEAWRTMQAPLDLIEALKTTDTEGPRLVDCLTIWLSNMMHHERNWRDAAQELAKAIPAQTSPVTFVTNEVGGGIVPDNALARAFRDAAGEVNQTIAAAVDDVYLAVAGYPLEVKKSDD